MSLHIDLYENEILECECGRKHLISTDSVYDTNITHNLGKMASEAGIYDALWRPYRLVDGYNIPEDNHDAEWKLESSTTIIAMDIIDIIEKGLIDLKARPEHFEKFDSSNGWGLYKHFVPFVEKYLNALKEHPKAIVKVDR